MKHALASQARMQVSASLLLLMLTLPAAAQIAGTEHDFSGRGWGTDQACVFCHTPHNGTTGLSAPLWNHALTAVTSYQLYNSTVSPTLNAVTGQPGGVSKLCLSCHDGTVAVDSFGARAGTSFVTGNANLGTDLSQDHPISFLYDAALVAADPGLKSPLSSAEVVAGMPLFAGKLECATCHDVHSNANTPFLRVSNAGSNLCLQCHNK